MKTTDEIALDAAECCVCAVVDAFETYEDRPISDDSAGRATQQKVTQDCKTLIANAIREAAEPLTGMLDEYQSEHSCRSGGDGEVTRQPCELCNRAITAIVALSTTPAKEAPNA